MSKKKNKLDRLAKEGIIDIDKLTAEQQAHLEKLLTTTDVRQLLKLNDRVKSHATLGPLSAVTRSSG